MKRMNADFKKKGTSVGKKTITKLIAVGVSVLTLCLTFFYLQNADSESRDTVKVVKIRHGMPAYAVVTKSDVEAYDIIKREYDSGEMALFEHVESEVYGKYTTNPLRKGTVLYKDQLTEEKPIRNEWLYSLSEGTEVVTIPYNSSEAGGDILLPGDLVRIRVSYETEKITPLFSEENPNIYQEKAGKTMQTDILFDSIVVKDMINASGHSVYEIYKEVMRLDEKYRQDVMQSKEFISNIKPKALLLAGAPEDMERYAAYKSKSSSSNFLITILSRANSDVGIDSLPTLETEVRSWIGG